MNTAKRTVCRVLVSCCNTTLFGSSVGCIDPYSIGYLSTPSHIHAPSIRSGKPGHLVHRRAKSHPTIFVLVLRPSADPFFAIISSSSHCSFSPSICTLNYTTNYVHGIVGREGTTLIFDIQKKTAHKSCCLLFSQSKSSIF